MAATRKPRLLVLTSTFPRWSGDPEPPFVFELSRRLTPYFAVTVLAPCAPGSLEREDMDGLRVIRFRYFFRRWENLATHSGGILNRLHANRLNYLLVPFFLGGQLWSLLRLLRRERFDLLHAHWLIPQGLSAILVSALVRAAPPLFCTSHGGDFYGLKGAVMNRLKQAVLRRSAHISVVSQALKDDLQTLGIADDKISVIPMGVDMATRFTPDPAQPRQACELLFVGRLVEKKGVEWLLRAMALVLERFPEARLSIAGSGPLERPLRHLADSLGISRCVSFLGMVGQRDLPALYRRATLFVAPFLIADSGDQEGLGLVMIEAMGCDCPVICGAVPATADVIEDGVTGIRVKPRDAQALAASIVQLLADPPYRRQLAANARQRSQRQFDWERIAARYRSALLSATSTAGAP
jgi:glycosyltransferase involved in cell wall biosynthesis